MTRAIRAAAVVRPVWTDGPLRVEGPDEDGFTLAVAALERLLEGRADPRPIERLSVVGPFPAEMVPYVGEAIGTAGLEVRRFPGGEAGLFNALAGATAAPGPAGPEAVVALDLRGASDGPTGPAGAGAVAFLVEEGPGVAVLAHGQRNHPPSRRPDATAWVRTVRHAAGPEDRPVGRLLIRAENPAPVLLAFWTRELPEMAVESLAPRDSSVGGAPSLGAALDLLEAGARTAPGLYRILARIDPEQTTYVGLRVEAPIELRVGPGTDPEPVGPRRPEPPVGAGISEGAYVARARYLEEIPSRWRFAAERCPRCGHRTFPARGRCRTCGNGPGLQSDPLPLTGALVEARTTIHAGAQPTEFDGWMEATGGYDVVLVRWPDGVRATLQVTDAAPGRVPLGAPVATRLRRLYRSDGEWRYGRKAIVTGTTASG